MEECFCSLDTDRCITWKSDRRPAISSAFMVDAMTWRAFFLNMLWFANTRMRCRMTLFSGRSEAVPFSRIHSCCSIWMAVARCLGFCAPTSPQ